MFDQLKRSDDVSRRAMLEYSAKSLLGVSVLPSVWNYGTSVAQAVEKAAGYQGGSAKRTILLYMDGGMTHLDTFDLKLGRAVQGATKGIQTKTPGYQVGENLEKLAGLTDKFAVVRSMVIDTADHFKARYLMRTAYPEIASIRHPGMGAWVGKHLGKRDRAMPDNVLVGPEGNHPMAGFMEASLTPIPIGNPIAGLQNIKSPEYLKPEHFGKRMALINSFDDSFRTKFPQKQVEAYTEFYTQSTKLMTSNELKPFDLSDEKGEVKQKYGGTGSQFGMGCLLARRLAQADVRFVEVVMGGWDMHVEIFARGANTMRTFDTAVSALISDLDASGLLKDTLVCMVSEFGRTPTININTGRDHHPTAFSALFAGGGAKGGLVYGQSDEDGMRIKDDGMSPADFNATIGYAMGMPLDKEVFSKSGRPFKVGAGGTPAKKIFA